MDGVTGLCFLQAVYEIGESLVESIVIVFIKLCVVYHRRCILACVGEIVIRVHAENSKT